VKAEGFLGPDQYGFREPAGNRKRRNLLNSQKYRLRKLTDACIFAA